MSYNWDKITKYFGTINQSIPEVVQRNDKYDKLVAVNKNLTTR